ncbi:MAG: aldehyde dehydrogenase [Candidatus Poseidoniaceae archaeon]|nr:aldehyde dehydrogenase [Candidatus Poseidoniaceae archaeon]
MIISNFIDGNFIPPIENRMMDDSNPANGAHIAMMPRASALDVDAAVLAAKRALPQWSALTMIERADWLDKIADALEEIKEEIAQTESLDTGKPISIARSVDATRSISNFRFFAKFARSQEPLIFEMSDATNHVHTSPLGIVGLITPWNLPLYLLTWKVAPALLMGNCIVAKPSELTPLTADLLAQTLQRIQLPDGVFNLVHGLGPEVGQAILEHPDIAGISFTGGTATGRIVARTAAPLFKKLSLELGGKNATIILDDANLDTVVPGAVTAAFTNSGQVCLCGSRILIHQSIYDEFCKRFVEQVDAMIIGDPSDESTQMGSVISMEHLQKIESYIDLAVEEGGEILSGGSRAMTGPLDSNPDAAFIRPTVIGGLSHLSRTSTEEIFGPVVTLHSFTTDDEAIEMANCTEYGLAGSIWTEDAERGKELAERVESGIVWVNTWLHRDLRTPFGGVKNSGVGREGGRWSLSFFSEMTNICVKH